MGKDIVWKGLAHVRPRPESEFPADVIGAYVNVLVLARERHLEEAVAAAVDDHRCDLIEVEAEPLEEVMHDDPPPDDWIEASTGLSAERRVWCHGTFHIYDNEDEAE